MTASTPESQRLRRIHQPRDCKSFIKELTDDLAKDYISAHINDIDASFGGAPIHSIVRQLSSDSQTPGNHHCPAADHLVLLLIYTTADVNLRDIDGYTPLHIAVKINCIQCAEVLLAFGAIPNVLDSNNQRPIDLATIRIAPIRTQTSWTLISTDKDEHDYATSLDDYTVYSEMRELLISVGGDHKYPSASSAASTGLEPSAELDESPFPEGFTTSNMFDEKERGEFEVESVDSGCRPDGDVSNSDEEDVPVAKSMQLQQKEIVYYKATGARVLSLDGGWMKSLIEIDVLEQLVLKTDKNITELFDWIVATSTGAIIILALLYAKKPLSEIRKLFYQLKDNIFASPHFGVSYNTSTLEKILISVFGTDMTMEHDSENMPKVIITAVNKKNKTTEVQYFSNCLNDDLCKTPVWKVARCTSAAPLLFEEFEDHVDGGVLANNSCQVGLTKIEDCHWDRQERLPLSLVVSVGTGINPPENLSSVSAQYFGTHQPTLLEGSYQEIGNLAELLSNALVESEEVARTTQTQCRERGIKFYRISPVLDENIVASETSNEKLCHMVVIARAKCKHQIQEIAKTLTSGQD